MTPSRHDRPSAAPLHVLIVGAGVGALETAVALRSLAGDAVRVQMLTLESDLGLNALDVGEPLGDELVCHYSLADVTAALGVDLVRGMLVGVEPEHHRVRCLSGRDIGYDRLVLAVDAAPVPTAGAAPTIERPVPGFPPAFDHILDDLRHDLAESLLVAVPDRVPWALPAYDLAIVSAARTGADILLATVERSPLELFGSGPSRAVASALTAAGVIVLTGVQTSVVSATAARIDGLWASADRIVTFPAAVGPAIPGIPSDPAGFVLTHGDGRVRGLDGSVFALGDGTSGPLAHGGLTAAVADRVASEIACGVGVPRRRDAGAPVVRGLLRTPEGPLFLSADLRDPEASGVASYSPLWWPPARVAAPWLSSFLADLEVRGQTPRS